MTEWVDIQTSLVRRHDLIAEIKAETITYTRLGGYNATPYSTMLDCANVLSAKSLKGTLRWWSRAAVVGALGGKIDYTEANKYLKKIYGGVKRREGEETIASKIKLTVETIFPPNFETRVRKIQAIYQQYYDKVIAFMNTVRESKDATISINPTRSSIEFNVSMNRLTKTEVQTILVKSPLREYVKTNPRYNPKSQKIVAKLNIHQLGQRCQFPRMRLLLMKRDNAEEEEINLQTLRKREIENYVSRVKEELTMLETEGIKFNIKLFGERDPALCNFVVSTLLLSLILGGVGSMTRRGFGSLKLVSIELNENVNWDTRLIEASEKLNSTRFDENSLRNFLHELQQQTIQYARTLFNISSSQQESSTPLVPSLHNLELRVVPCQNYNLTSLGQAFLKNTLRENKRDDGLHTWVLGLPRFRGETGYFEPEERRRISSIALRIFSNHGNRFVVLYGFLTDDWPEKLNHRGRRSTKINAKSELKTTYQNVFTKIESLVKNQCQSRMG
ncbi:MAG: RAMP superfamily CRISPR-associated protein [Candidatus Caldarchaeum sp.]